MGCHAIEFFRWILGGGSSTGKGPNRVRLRPDGHLRPRREDRGDDEAVLLLTFEGGAIGLAEESWNKPGGMDDRAEVYGSDGQAYADLLYGNSLRAFSRRGYGYAVEKAGSTAGWSFPIYQEIWNYGFPQEMEHFVSCVRTGRTPTENGHDGRAVVEAVFALYESAARGRRIDLPFASDRSSPDRSLAAARSPVDSPRGRNQPRLLPPLPHSLERRDRMLEAFLVLRIKLAGLQRHPPARTRRSGRARPATDGKAARPRHSPRGSHRLRASVALPSMRSSLVRRASSSLARSAKWSRCG